MSTKPASIAITGASSGIGAALAVYYAAPGATLWLAGRSAPDLAQVAALCREKGAVVFEALFDIREANKLCAWLQDADGRAPLDLVIANAGMAATRGAGMSAERFADVTAQADVNFRGTLQTAHLAAERMLARGRGHIALISSLNALFPVGDSPTYSATKAGIVAYAIALRDWLEGSGVTVSVACPGFVETRLAEGYIGPRPLQIDAAAAAALIGRGIARGRFHTAFPWPLALGARIGRLIPRSLVRLVLRPYRARITPSDENPAS